MKKMMTLMFLLLAISWNSSNAVEMGEDQKGDCIDGVQKSRSTVSQTDSSESTRTNSPTASGT